MPGAKGGSLVILCCFIPEHGSDHVGPALNHRAVDADELCLSLGIGNKAAVELLVQLCNLSVSVCEDLSLLRRNIRVADSKADESDGYRIWWSTYSPLP